MRTEFSCHQWKHAQRTPTVFACENTDNGHLPILRPRPTLCSILQLLLYFLQQQQQQTSDEGIIWGTRSLLLANFQMCVEQPITDARPLNC
jgi:hypothetical protein